MQSIENELLKRLKEGVYGDIYDPVKEYNKLTDDIEVNDAMIEHEEEDVCISVSPLIVFTTWFSHFCGVCTLYLVVWCTYSAKYQTLSITTCIYDLV